MMLLLFFSIKLSFFLVQLIQNCKINNPQELLKHLMLFLVADRFITMASF